MNGVKATWSASPPHNVPAPECRETQFTRDNHLGNTYGGNPPVYNWTLPNIAADKCVFRIRYNISTNDYDSWTTYQPGEVNINAKMGLTADEAAKRGYTFQNQPKVKLFADLDVKLNLAINTAQYGRVFQDRY